MFFLEIYPISSVADPDPGSAAFFDPWNPGWVKNQDLDPGWTMNIPDHISESLETIFWVKILKFFDADADPGSGIKKNLIRDPG
jgi:hypothetical protein